jgi:hypothetical protein
LEKRIAPLGCAVFASSLLPFLVAIPSAALLLLYPGAIAVFGDDGDEEKRLGLLLPACLAPSLLQLSPTPLPFILSFSPPHWVLLVVLLLLLC